MPEVRADASESSSPDLHGVVVHVGTGWERPFRSSQELVAFVRAWVCPVPAQRYTAEFEGGKGPGGPVGRADIDPRRTLETQSIQEVES